MVIALALAAPPETVLLWAACGVVGLAVFWAVWWMVRVLQSDDLPQGAEWRYDVSRINELRRADPFYRFFQPAIRILGAFNRRLLGESLASVQREIQISGLPRFWLAEEYLGKIEIITLLVSPIFVYFFVAWFAAGGLVLVPPAVVALGWLLRRHLAQRAARRLQAIKRRMPFLLDLLTLLMEAGSTFLGAMRQAVREFRGHPVAEEFGRVLTDIDMGKTRAEAFQALRDRLSDDEITSIVNSVLQGEFLGTPLSQVFRAQADVLRIKRSQRAETVAGEAGVNMLLPATLVMVATVLIILGPFLLNYLVADLTL